MLRTSGAVAQDVRRDRPVLEPWAWVVLVALVVVAYARTIGFGLFNDDYVLIRPWTGRELLNAFHGQFDQVGQNEKYFRPMASLSFATEWHVWGTKNWGYHLTNIAIHCAAVVGVWLVLRRLRVMWWAAFVGAAYFAVVPSNVAAVVYIAQRTDAMVAVCMCAILWCVARFGDTGARRWLMWASGWYVLALLCKEVAVAAVPFVAVFWLYLRVERVEPLSSGPDAPGLRTHWANEARIIGRSLKDRSARWLTVLAPFIVITVVYLAYRSAVLPASSLTGRFSEGKNPISALLGGMSSTVKGVPWGNAALALLPLIALFVIGFLAHPRARAWRVVLLGVGGMISGVLPLAFSGSIEPRLLYVPMIGMAMAIAGLATVLGEAVAASRRRQLLRAALGAVSVVLAITIGVSHVQSQNLYRPGTSNSLYYDLRTWVWSANAKAAPENMATIERHLRDAGLLDEDGNLAPGVVDEDGNVIVTFD